MSEEKRLDKRLIELIKCSRSEAEKYIAGGWVLVDDEVVDTPQFKVTTQQVALHPDATLDPIRPATLLFNQGDAYDAAHPTAPLKAITPESREAHDDSMRTLKRHFYRLMPTVALEHGATGLMIFTQDRRIADKLTKAKTASEEEYIVEVSGSIEADGPEAILETLNRPLMRNGKPLPKVKVSWQNEIRLRFALKNKQPDQIKFMCEQVGLKIEAMQRIRVGRIPMAKLQPGQWRYLPDGALF